MCSLRFLKNISISIWLNITKKIVHTEEEYERNLNPQSTNWIQFSISTRRNSQLQLHLILKLLYLGLQTEHHSMNLYKTVKEPTKEREIKLVQFWIVYVNKTLRSTSRETRLKQRGGNFFDFWQPVQWYMHYCESHTNITNGFWNRIRTDFSYLSLSAPVQNPPSPRQVGRCSYFQ